MRILRYRQPDGSVPFDEWIGQLADRKAKAQIAARIHRSSGGNFGDHVSVGEGVFEMRIHTGPGYRVYFARHGAIMIVLLCGGDKRSQSKDILLAKQYWRSWKRSWK